MPDTDPVFIPVILGTARKGRNSANVARFVHAQLEARPGVETKLIDVAELAIGRDGPGQHARDEGFTADVERADGFVLVVPEYNHGYPGILKTALDSNLKEYIHKAVGVCGVSAGPFGGSRVIEHIAPVLRELGLVMIFWDLNFSKVRDAFDASGALKDPAYERRAGKFLGELIWMSKVLREGRRSVPSE